MPGTSVRPSSRSQAPADEAVQVRRGLVAMLQTFGEGPAGEAQGQAVIGLDGHAAGLVADQLREAPAQLQGRAAVEAEQQDAPRVDAQDPQQVGTAMHHHPRLAGPGSGQHQPVALFRGGDDLDLGRVAEGIDDAPEGLGRGGALQDLACGPGSSGLHEARLAQGEVGADQRPGPGGSSPPPAGRIRP